MNNLPALRSGVEFTKVGLVYHGDVTFKQWERDGQLLRYFHKTLAFCWGDWLAYGETRWGEMYSQALEESDYELGTLRNAKWVCGRIETERRRQTLSFGHHQVVAPMEVKDQEKWMDEAEKRKWTVAELRRAIKGEPVVKTLEQTMLKITEAEMTFDEWWKKGEKQSWFKEMETKEVARAAWQESRRLIGRE